MDIWYDTEFLENGRTIDLISLGMVREDGETLYAVNEEMLHPGPHCTPAPDGLYARVAKHEWLMTNVVPHLPLHIPGDGRKSHGPVGSTLGGWGFFHVDPESPYVLPKRLIRAQVRDFVLGVEAPRLWANYGAYDHLVLCQLFGKMIDLPKHFPMFTNDVQTLGSFAGARTGDEPKQEYGLHNALMDAHHTRNLHGFYLNRMRGMDW